MFSIMDGTNPQRLRRAQADAATEDALYLIKRVSVMHATYQVRLLAYHAYEEGLKLIIEVPPYCQIAPSLETLMRTIPGVIDIERH